MRTVKTPKPRRTKNSSKTDLNEVDNVIVSVANGAAVAVTNMVNTTIQPRIDQVWQ